MKMRIARDKCETDEMEIYERLKAYNLLKREPSENSPLDIFYEDEDGNKYAGLVAEVFGNWLCIHYLFVNEKFRGRGVGKKIIQIAEEEARNRGCRFAFVDTFSFQAPEFYEKLGYKEVFALKEYPYKGARYYYTKDL